MNRMVVRRIVKFISMFVLLTFFFPVLISYAETEMSDILIEILPDKTEYKTEDSVDIDINVLNGGGYDLKDITVLLDLPSTISGIEQKEYKIEKIESGEEWSIGLSGTIVGGEGIVIVESDKTIEKTSLFSLWLILGVIIALILSLVIVRTKKTKEVQKILIALLAISCSLGLLNGYVNVNAEVSMFELSKSKRIFINGSESLISVLVKGTVQEEIVYEDDNAIIKVNHKETIVTQESGENINLNQVVIENGPSNPGRNDENQGEIESVPPKDNLGEITIASEDKVKIDCEEVTLIGTAEDLDGIKEIQYYIDNLAGSVITGTAIGKENWTIIDKVEVGTSVVSVCVVDIHQNSVCDDVQVVRTSDILYFNEEVKPLTIDESYDFWDCYRDFMYNVKNDQSFYVIFFNSEFFQDKINELSSSVVYVPGNALVPTGFTGKVISIYLPSELSELGTVEDIDLGLYSDKEYIVVEFSTVTMNEIIDGDICFNVDDKTITEQDVSFVLGPNGEVIYSKDALSRARSKVTVPLGDQSLNYTEKIYENGPSSISLDLSIGLRDIKISTGWENKDEEQDYRQLYLEMDLDPFVNGSIDGDVEGNLENIVKRINTFCKDGDPLLKELNKHLSGVDLEKEIILATIGIEVTTFQVVHKTVGPGHLNEYLSLPIPTLILLNFVLCTDGTVKAVLNGSIDISSHIETGLAARKKTFLESLFTWDSWKNRITGDWIGAEFDIKAYSEFEKPNLELEVGYSANGELTLGAGANAMWSFLGIVPAKIGINFEHTNTFTGFEGKWGFSTNEGPYGKHEMGKMDSVTKLLLEPQFKFSVKDDDGKSKITLEYDTPITLKEWKKKEATFTINVYDNKYDKNPVGDHYQVSIHNIDSGEEFMINDFNNGSGTLYGITSFGRYGVKVIDTTTNKVIVDPSISFRLEGGELTQINFYIEPETTFLFVYVIDSRTNLNFVEDNCYRLWLKQLDESIKAVTNIVEGKAKFTKIPDLFGDFIIELEDIETGEIVYAEQIYLDGGTEHKLIYLSDYEAPEPDAEPAILSLNVYDNEIDKNYVANNSYHAIVREANGDKKVVTKVKDGFAVFKDLSYLIGTFIIEIQDIETKEILYRKDNVELQAGEKYSVDIYLFEHGNEEIYPDLKAGDYFTLGQYNDEDILWRVVGEDDNGLLVVSDRILTIKSFDAKGPSEEYHGGLTYYTKIRKENGSNCWEDSNLRQWLNSTDSNVQWTHDAPSDDNVYEGYNSYDDEGGFLSANNFTTNELEKIKTTTRKVYVNIAEYYRNKTNGGNVEHQLALGKDLSKQSAEYSNCYFSDIEDQIFVPDIEQLRMIEKNLSTDYLVAYPTESAVSLSEFKSDELSSSLQWATWINHPSTDGASFEHVGILEVNGLIGYSAALYSGIGVRPAFYLADMIIVEKGEGTLDNPYKFR